MFKDKILVKRALTVEVCAEHAAIVDCNVQRCELEREIRRLEGTLKRANLRHPETVEAQLEKSRTQLQELAA